MGLLETIRMAPSHPISVGDLLGVRCDDPQCRNNYTRTGYEDTSSNTFANASAALSVTLLTLTSLTTRNPYSFGSTQSCSVEIPLYIRATWSVGWRLNERSSWVYQTKLWMFWRCTKTPKPPLLEVLGTRSIGTFAEKTIEGPRGIYLIRRSMTQ